MRSWVKDLASMRAVVLSDDPRICAENLGTIPRIRVESSGWPGNAAAGDIVKACHHATGYAPIPTRAYRSMGVNFWTLLFAEDPGKSKFSVCFNGNPTEILLMTGDAMKQLPKRSKEHPRAKHSTSQSSKAEPSHKVDMSEHVDRISMLESRFNVVEKKQEAMEVRMDQSFTNVQDQLRQILQAVQGPRSPSHGSTGLTPPPKAHKSGV